MSLDPATNIDPQTGCGREAAWAARLLQTGDSYYPTGSYSHSYGLEGLVEEGVLRNLDSLRDYFFHALLPNLERLELPLAAQAYRALGASDWSEVAQICELAKALKATRETREASAKVGQQRVELLARLHPDSVANEFLQRQAEEDWRHSSAVAAAVEGHVLRMPLGAVLGGLIYTTLSGQLAAAMKILRVGQNAAQALLTEALADTTPMVERALQIERDDIGWFNPWLDIASARHETAPARMFIS